MHLGLVPRLRISQSTPGGRHARSERSAVLLPGQGVHAGRRPDRRTVQRTPQRKTKNEKETGGGTEKRGRAENDAAPPHPSTGSRYAAPRRHALPADAGTRPRPATPTDVDQPSPPMPRAAPRRWPSVAAAALATVPTRTGPARRRTAASCSGSLVEPRVASPYMAHRTRPRSDRTTRRRRHRLGRRSRRGGEGSNPAGRPRHNQAGRVQVHRSSSDCGGVDSDAALPAANARALQRASRRGAADISRGAARRGAAPRQGSRQPPRCGYAAAAPPRAPPSPALPPPPLLSSRFGKE